MMRFIYILRITGLAKEAKAIYRIRRIVLVNTEIIDEYIENFRDI